MPRSGIIIAYNDTVNYSRRDNNEYLLVMRGYLEGPAVFIAFICLAILSGGDIG